MGWSANAVSIPSGVWMRLEPQHDPDVPSMSPEQQEFLEQTGRSASDFRNGTLVMGMIEGKTLESLRGTKEGDEAQVQLFDAIKTMHLNGIAHRDLHSGNIMYSNHAGIEGKKRPFLIDYSMAELGYTAALQEALFVHYEQSSYKADVMPYQIGTSDTAKQIADKKAKVMEMLESAGVPKEVVRDIENQEYNLDIPPQKAKAILDFIYNTGDQNGK